MTGATLVDLLPLTLTLSWRDALPEDISASDLRREIAEALTFGDTTRCFVGHAIAADSVSPLHFEGVILSTIGVCGIATAVTVDWIPCPRDESDDVKVSAAIHAWLGVRSPPARRHVLRPGVATCF